MRLLICSDHLQKHSNTIIVADHFYYTSYVESEVTSVLYDIYMYYIILGAMIIK
jgi:hypothetical protein